MKTIDGTHTLQPTKNDLPEKLRGEVVELLNERLADAIDLMLQAKQAHWNVKGPSFIALHELFDKVYEVTAEYVDLLAERAVQLGGSAHGTVRLAAANSSLDEYPADLTDAAKHVDLLARAMATFGESVRAGIERAQALGDADTADILTEISRGTDKYLWFVEAHQQK
jgi:starvation-inducible DNA-binding protein